jgi:prevent-host-death family protein
MPKARKNEALILPALFVRKNFGALLGRLERDQNSLVIEKRGTPRAVLLGIREYIKLAGPEPEVLRAIGEESKAKGTHKLTSKQIDKIVRAARSRSKSRRK